MKASHFGADQATTMMSADACHLPLGGVIMCLCPVLGENHSPSFRDRWLRESWIRGCSGSRTIPSVGLQNYEDTRLKTASRVRMGLSLAWKASLAMRIFKICYHCNRLYLTLTLSGVYINRRVVVRRTSTP